MAERSNGRAVPRTGGRRGPATHLRAGPARKVVDSPVDIWTFGHSDRSIDQTVALLRHHRVERVVDVRAHASSKHSPQHDGMRMRAWLAQAGIDYAHLPDLGGRRGRQPDVDPAVNAGWSNTSFHHYADWTLNP